MVEEKNDIKAISLQEKPGIEKNLFNKPEQSANVLYKFMKKIDYLKDILEHNAIMPRYYEEKINYLNIDFIEKIAFPMSCFCDIHLNKLEKHMEKYGGFGIGLSKKWGVEVGIQPIQYINVNSKLRVDFSEVFSSIFNMKAAERKNYSHYHDYILHHLLFMKPIHGEMIVKADSYEKRHFHDEKEWRFVPDVASTDTELPMVIDQKQMNPRSYHTYSQAIRKKPELWLKFDFDQVKYIIVQDENDRNDIINFIIEKQIGDSETERYILVSKIITFSELGEDW
ncbi:abortive infection system antitoxin AbiGi family protein [Virgibacillus ainsalahensis]